MGRNEIRYQTELSLFKKIRICVQLHLYFNNYITSTTAVRFYCSKCLLSTWNNITFFLSLYSKKYFNKYLKKLLTIRAVSSYIICIQVSINLTALIGRFGFIQACITYFLI